MEKSITIKVVSEHESRDHIIWKVLLMLQLCFVIYSVILDNDSTICNTS
jgi:hypothetical protein